MKVTKKPGPYLAIAGAIALMASAVWLPAGRAGAAAAPGVVISEIHPAGSSAGYAADWFEVTNTGTTTVDITGWKFDDNSNTNDLAVALRGVTSLAPGASAIFLEGRPDATTDATIIANFSTAWFGSATPPAGMLIGTYGGSGVGMSGSGDAVNLFDAAGVRVTGVSFGAAATGSPLATFDNSAGLGAAVLPLPPVTTLSADKVNGAFVSFNGAEVGSPGARILASPLTGIDLSTYVRVGRFDLPEPTRTVPPPGSLLAQEASGVTYNWDADTLFIATDGSTSIVQVTKTGELIDSMTLPPGGSPQGTEFYDLEGIAYVGNGQFVFVEERDRQAVLFTYVAGTTLTRAATRTVKLGTTIGNEGLEGLTYDRATNGDPATAPNTKGFIFVKEINPQGLFQSGVDFVAGTATNGSPATVNSTNLFDPALLGLTDIADVYALSNLPGMTGSQRNNLLVLSQEEGVIVNVDRSGVISSSLTIVDAGNPQPVADQGHEGIAVDGNGVLYIVSENGGGDVNHPQLWVYAPSLVPNQPPTDLVLTNQVTTLPENSNTAARIRVANVSVTDDGLGTNVLGVAGADASAFEVDASGLYVKAGTVLDFEAKSTYNVTVTVDDVSVGTTPDATADFTLTLTDIVNEEPPASSSIFITEVTPWASGNSPYAADWFELTNKGAAPVNITGWQVDDDSNGAGLIALNGITEIGPGESVIFMEATAPNFPATRTAFLTAWFGANAPAGLQIGSYTGSGIGLSTGGDNVNLFDAGGNRITGVTLPVSTTAFTFDNAAGAGSTVLPLPIVSTLSVVGVNGAFLAADSHGTGSPGRIAGGGIVLPSVIISEITPWGSGNSPYGSDWFEVTNIGPGPVDITGWKMDDDSGLFGSAVALNGITSIAAGESVIFMESNNPAAAKSEFLIAWFGGAANAPAGLQIGSYTGTGVGLGTGGDEVSLFLPGGQRITGVKVGASTVGATFDNAAGLGGTESPLPTVPGVSVVGVNGAFQAADGHGRGSPGRIANPIVLPLLKITEVVPWSSGNGNSPYRADWFEVTNVGATPVDITGMKFDDNSGSFANAVALTGVSVIAPGESVIFMETADLPATKASFLTAWFGGSGPAGLQIGSYSGSGVGLSTDGDEVSLFLPSGHRITGVGVGASTTGFTFDNAAGAGASAPPLPAITTLSVVGANGAFLAADGHGTGSPGRIVTPDTTAPVLTAPDAISSTTADSTGAVITFDVTAVDDVDGATPVTCVPPSGTKFAVGVTTVTCSSTDAAGNTGTDTFDVTIIYTPPATPDGRIYGVGHVDDAGKHHHFLFRVSEVGSRDYGRFEYFLHDRKMDARDDDDYARHHERNGDRDADYGRDRKKFVSRFEAATVASVEFSDDPRTRPGAGRWGFLSFLFQQPRVDSVTFTGTGKWNGKAGYTFKVIASDKGEPGRRRDTFSLVIKDAAGKVVASVDDVIDGGNIQSTRLLFGWF